MPDNAITFIDEVSNDPAAVGQNQLLTAEAIENKLPAAPEITQFTNADLSAGKLLMSYASGKSIIFWTMKDENDVTIQVPAEMDDAGTFIEFDFTTIEDPENPGIYIVGTWTVALWASTGPIGVEPAPIAPGENNTGRVRLEPPTGDIDLKVAAPHTIFTVQAGTLLALEELEITLVDAAGVLTQASVSLEVVSGDTILASTVIPIDAQYERYALDISTSNVLPAGSVVRITVTVAGTAVGNMNARVYLFGYIDEV